MNVTKSVTVGDPESPSEVCNQCGHNWNSHRLCGYGNPLTEGWVECPETGCPCKKTWSLPAEVAERIKADRR